MNFRVEVKESLAAQSSMKLLLSFWDDLSLQLFGWPGLFLLYDMVFWGKKEAPERNVRVNPNSREIFERPNIMK